MTARDVIAKALSGDRFNPLEAADYIEKALYEAGFKIVEQEKLTVAVGTVRAGQDYPCSLHKGPAGNCSPWNCRCY